MPLESRQDSRLDYRRVLCDRCGGTTSFVAQVSPLGSEPGVRIYHCPACTCFTVREWRGLDLDVRPHAEHMASGIPLPAEPAQQRAQRHQQKDDSSGG